MAFSPDGQLLAMGGRDGLLRLWDVVREAPRGLPLRGHTWEVGGVAFSPDGQTLASGSDDWNVRLWDVATGQPRGGARTGHTDRVSGIAFSPDGRTLASASADGTVRLWDVDVEPLPMVACRRANRNLTLTEWVHYLGDAPYQKTCPDLPAAPTPQ
jgi:WD40 repeat protein